MLGISGGSVENVYAGRIDGDEPRVSGFLYAHQQSRLQTGITMHAEPTTLETPLSLASFRGKHHGETIIVCGCGESLNELNQPIEAVTIGVNDVGRLFDPTYLVVVNPRNQFKADRFRFVEQSNAQVLFTQLDLGPVRPRRAQIQVA